MSDSHFCLASSPSCKGSKASNRQTVSCGPNQPVGAQSCHRKLPTLFHLWKHPVGLPLMIDCMVGKWEVTERCCPQALHCQMSIPRSHSSMRRVQVYNRMPQSLTSNCHHSSCFVPHLTNLVVRSDGTNSGVFHSNHSIVERCNADNHSDHTVSVHYWEFPQVLDNTDKLLPSLPLYAMVAFHSDHIVLRG